ncbi:hydrogenase maturation protease [Streptosporangium amethystogenes]|uniref:hydrogenase maturation protease n=1 Tax=Streptosporangium amethystogenes TaxID=2002 RepID=UPI0004CAEA24|nr:hydrogenase maturation protease [Streptosporangium amethystogenes]
MHEQVVIGIGNELRGDDAAGLQVARLLRGVLPPEVPVVENGGDPAELIEAWTGAGLAIVIDTVLSGAPPGTVRRCTVLGPAASSRGAHQTAPALRHGSSHALGIADAVALGRILRRLPRELALYTVEGADFGLGAPVTPAVKHAVGKLAETVADLVRPERAR